MLSEVADLIQAADVADLAKHLWAMPLEDLERIAAMDGDGISAALEREGHGM